MLYVYYMEKIGYIHKNNLAFTNGLNSIDILKETEIHYGFRDIVEEQNDIIQPICAGVIITKDNRILSINKTSKSTSNNSPEKNKTLLYIGGHLDISDTSNSNIQTFINGMKREISEELGLEIKDDEIKNPILTYTPISEKSTKHLGVIFLIIIQNEFNLSFTDGNCKFIDISSVYKITNLESWSEIILKEIIDKLNTENQLQFNQTIQSSSKSQ